MIDVPFFEEKHTFTKHMNIILCLSEKSFTFLKELIQEEDALYEERLMRRTRYNINEKVITVGEEQGQIFELIQKCRQLQYLRQVFEPPTRYQGIVNLLLHRHLLNYEGKIVHFIMPND